MRQQTILQCFGVISESNRKSQRCHLLEISLDIRQRIYQFAGLVRFCPINLNLEGHRRAENVKKQEPQGLEGSQQRLPGAWRTKYPLSSPRRTCDYQCRPNRMLFYEDGLKCFCAALPSTIMYTCRTVSHEMTVILYGANSFDIDETNYGGLSHLHRLRP